jgi:glycosyltransferase involved in cell wall biosynthesis
VKILASEKWAAPGGGMERSMLEVAEGLSDRGHDLRLMYRFPGEYLPIYASFGATTRQARSFFIDRGDTVRSALGLIPTTAAGVRARPDLVYLNDILHAPFGALVSSITRRPLVAHLRLNPPDDVLGRQIWASLPRIRRFIAVSSDTRTRYADFGFPQERIDVVHNAVDLDRYTPPSDTERQAARERLGIEDDEYLIVYIGRIDAVKGIDTLINATNRLVEQGLRVRLVVAGRPAWHETPEAGLRYVEELQRRALPGSATFLGVQLDTLPLYRAADVVAVPSNWPEPFGRVIVEAMACGLPVVASDIGGIPEILTEDLRQLLVTPGDSDDLAARLQSVRADAAELGRACRRVAEARFGSAQMLDGIEASFARATS